MRAPCSRSHSCSPSSPRRFRRPSSSRSSPGSRPGSRTSSSRRSSSTCTWRSGCWQPCPSSAPASPSSARATMRIGEVAARTGTTARTIRYYEELGLLDDSGVREKGKHRSYSESDVERLQDLIRLRELLGVSLEDLKAIVEAEDARAALRAEWQEGAEGGRRPGILHEGLNPGRAPLHPRPP